MANLERYQNGKIYKLVNDVDDEIYVGSTCLPLRQRLYKHKGEAKKRPNRHVYKHLNEISWDVVKIILIEKYPCSDNMDLLKRERYWIEELKPSLNKVVPTRTDKEWYNDNRKACLEKAKKYSEDNHDKYLAYQKDYYVNNKDKILEYQRNYSKNNSDVIAAKKKEFYKTNKDGILQYHKQYYKEKKDVIAEKGKEYREKNEVVIKQRGKEYRERNKEKLKERRKIYAEKKWTCEVCNCQIRITGKSNHLKSKTHTNKVNNPNQ